MRYPIKVSGKSGTFKKDGIKLSVYVDQIPVLAVPAAIAVSVGNKETMYRKYLDNRIFDEKDKQQLLGIIVQLHDKAIENNGIELVCNCKFNKFHGKVLKEFIESNSEMFDSLLTYMVPNSKNKNVLNANKKQSKLPEDFKSENLEQAEFAPDVMLPMAGNKMTLDQLNVPGADQLRALIKADMEREAREAIQHTNSNQDENTEEVNHEPEIVDVEYKVVEEIKVPVEPAVAPI